eukprot:scaffold290783_cov31-Attheya_sp.AAC.1
MSKKEVDIFGFAKTNIVWTPERKSQAYQHGRGRFKQLKLETSSSNKPRDFVGRVTETGQDPHRLGRWSYVRLGVTDGKQTYIITAYPVSQDSNSSGDTTAHKQQVRLLWKRDIENPKPREQWFTDMEKQTTEWIAQGASVILMVDAKRYELEIY